MVAVLDSPLGRLPTTRVIRTDSTVVGFDDIHPLGMPLASDEELLRAVTLATMASSGSKRELNRIAIGVGRIAGVM
jgi:hypothetical protein